MNSASMCDSRASNMPGTWCAKGRGIICWFATKLRKIGIVPGTLRGEARSLTGQGDQPAVGARPILLRDHRRDGARR